MTEKQTEDWLKLETRNITMPDGSTRPISMFKLHWNGYDFLVAEWKTFTEEKLVQIALNDAARTGRSFEQQFPNIVAYAYRTLRKQLGIG